MTRIPYENIQAVLVSVLLKVGFETERAALCARLFTDASRDGVYSHGLNRIPRFNGDDQRRSGRYSRAA